jgi:hypothetical protein
MICDTRDGKEASHMIEQLSLFPSPPSTDPRPPETVTWNPIHGCTKHSTGCLHCYMFRRDESVGKDPTVVRKTQSFNLPVARLANGELLCWFQLLRIQWEALLHGSSFLKAACQLADERKRIHDYPDRDENRHSGLLF